MHVPGNIALLHQPGDLREWVQLSPYLYSGCIKEMRRHLSFSGGREGVMIVEVWAPIDAPRVAVALDRRSLYVFGIRGLPDGDWWCFRDLSRPADPPGAKVREMPGDGGYSDLGLPESVAVTPVKLLRDLAAFDGRYADPGRARNILALAFLVGEALRFESLLDEGQRYTHSSVLHPAAHAATVKNWARLSAAGSRDVAVRHIPSERRGARR